MVLPKPLTAARVRSALQDCSSTARYSSVMAPQRKVLTVDELDSMTTAERDAAFKGSVVGDLGGLPDDVRDRFIEHGRRLTRELHSSPE